MPGKLAENAMTQKTEAQRVAIKVCKGWHGSIESTNERGEMQCSHCQRSERAIREFAKAVAEKIDAEKPDWYDAKMLLLREAGIDDQSNGEAKGKGENGK